MQLKTILSISLLSAFLAAKANAYVDENKSSLARANAAFTIQSLVNNRCSTLPMQRRLAISDCQASLMNEKVLNAYIDYYMSTFTKDELDVFVSTYVMHAQSKTFSEEKARKILQSYMHKKQKSIAVFDSISPLAFKS